MDVSLAMLHVAAREIEASAWAPRLACADGFRLPLRAGALDAVTVAFGMRNLRPRREALAEIARVLAPGGTLCVLEATVPARGPLAPFARAWIRHAIPLAGRLSPDPSAYRYLRDSIFEFGSGPEFEADLAASGFALVGSRGFLFGGTRLWVAERGPVLGQKTTERPEAVQRATRAPGETAHRPRPLEREPAERATWQLLQAITGTALTATLVWAFQVWLKVGARLPLTPVQRFGGGVLLVGGLLVFGVRSVVQWLRWSASRSGGVRSR
jgi:demethylmenaquinone methyltransferase/2-methoxy-6-polyprenyl-1,4-benzoquinol methylase